MSVSTIIIVAFIICLAVLGHTVWHHEMVAFMNIIVGFFTGGHATG